MACWLRSFCTAWFGRGAPRARAAAQIAAARAAPRSREESSGASRDPRRPASRRGRAPVLGHAGRRLLCRWKPPRLGRAMRAACICSSGRRARSRASSNWSGRGREHPPRGLRRAGAASMPSVVFSPRSPPTTWPMYVQAVVEPARGGSRPARSRRRAPRGPARRPAPRARSARGWPVGREIGRRQHAREVAGGREHLRRKLAQTAAERLARSSALACAVEHRLRLLERGQPLAVANARSAPSAALLTGALLARCSRAARASASNAGGGAARRRPRLQRDVRLRGTSNAAEPRESPPAAPRPPSQKVSAATAASAEREARSRRRQHLAASSRFCIFRHPLQALARAFGASPACRNCWLSSRLRR